jgi:hypothetical protein
MAATAGGKTIPTAGQVFLGDNPSPSLVIKVTAGVDCGDVTAIDTTAAFCILNIPANTIVSKVNEYVQTAWSAASTFVVGDCDSAGQFVNTAAGSTTAAAFKAETGLQVSQYYDTPSAITITLANAGAGNTVGKSDFFIWYNLAGQATTY